MDDLSLNAQYKEVAAPSHVAIIMDGNGRWAQQQRQQRIFGHRNGYRPIEQCIQGAMELGVKHLTLYAFSTENWSRPEQEVKGLFSLLLEVLQQKLPHLQENNIRLHWIGQRHLLSSELCKALEAGVEQTAQNTGLQLILAFNYGAREEIIQAVNEAVQQQQLVDVKRFSSLLQTKAFPDPDLLIRTSGEYRLSNFLLWQLAYTELYFTPVLWPDFSKEDFIQAVEQYQRRNRRFGGL